MWDKFQGEYSNMSNTFIVRLLTVALLLLLTSRLSAAELPNFTQLVKAHSSAVVNISTEREEEYKQPLPPSVKPPLDNSNSNSNEVINDLMKRFFDYNENPEGGIDESSSLGSGFIISTDGYIVTNHHVVAGADKIIVKLSDKQELPAKLIGTDKRSDIALLKIEGSGFPVLTTGSSSQLEVGEWVIAIGSPFGFDHSVTAGIVSAKGRSLPEESYVPFIQTDVAINPGNSGGPLFNMKGEVVGINSQIYSQSGSFAGVSFAIPVDVVKNVVAQLKMTGHVKRGWLGVFVQEVTVSLAKSFGLNQPEGALIAEVMREGSAIGILKQGDIILEFNNKKVNTASDLTIIVGGTSTEKEVDVKIRRGGKTQIVKLKLKELPTEVVERKKKVPVRFAKSNAVMGMELENLTTNERKSLQINNGGIIVRRIDSGRAHRAGMQADDVIKIFNGQAVSSVKQFKSLVNSLPNGTPVAALVLREGSAQFVALMIEHTADNTVKK